MFSYKQKYLKYKIKYETLKKKFNQIGGLFISDTLVNVITYNDPFFSGTLLDGDVDDIISIIFLAIKFREKLTIIIRNQEGRKRDTNIECKNFLFLINKLYTCTIIYDDNLDGFDYTKHYDIGFVCAPMIDKVITLFNSLVANKTNVYVQGGTIGYNYVNSYNNGLGLTKNVIHLSSESTNGSLPLSLIDSIYTGNKFFRKINLYQLKKLFGLMPVQIQFATTVWLDKVEYPGWGNTGNSWKTYLRITELMTEEQRDNLDKDRLDERLKTAYDNYISVIIDVKFNSIRLSNDFDNIGLTKDEVSAYKKQILGRRGEVSGVLKTRLYSVGKLMQRILTPLQINDLYVKLCGEEETEIIGEIAQVPESFEVEPGLLPKTPALFDFNTTFGVINALDSEVISIFDPSSEEFRLQLESGLKSGLETYIKGFEDTRLSIIIDNFNGIIKQFINDIDLLDNEDEKVINAKKDFIMI
jgi:hypothetical protein